MTQPKRDDEIAFYNALRNVRRTVRVTSGYNIELTSPSALEVARGLGMNLKRAHYLLEKWYDKGWIDCGVSLWRGWFTSTSPSEMTK